MPVSQVVLIEVRPPIRWKFVIKQQYTVSVRYFPPSTRSRVDADSLLAEWERLARDVPGEVSIQLRGPDGPVASLCADSPHYAASTVKLAVAVAALVEATAGRVDLDSVVAIRSDFDSAAGGRFAMRQADDQDDRTWARRGEPVPLADLVERMIVDSSNIATNLIIEHITAAAVHRVLADARVSRSALRHLLGDERAMAGGILNTITAGGLARLMSALAGGRLLPALRPTRSSTCSPAARMGT